MLRTLLALLLLAAPALAHNGPGYFHDPVVTHTNGMRIASTTSLRSHNVYWQCEEGRHGYCDGLLRSPCRDELRTLFTRCHGRFVPPYTPAGPTGSRSPHTIEGLETADGESLGFLGARAIDPAAAQATAPPAPDLLVNPTALQVAGATEEPGANSNWLSTLQKLGRKIATPEN